MFTIQTPFIIPLGEDGVGRDTCLRWGPYDVYQLETRFSLLLKAKGLPVESVRSSTEIVRPTQTKIGHEKLVFLVEISKEISKEVSKEVSKETLQEILDGEVNTRKGAVGVASLHHLGFPKWWIDNVIPSLKFKDIHVEGVEGVGWLAYAYLSNIEGYIDETVRLERVLEASLKELYEGCVFAHSHSLNVPLVYPVNPVVNERTTCVNGHLYKVMSTYRDPILMRFAIQLARGNTLVRLMSLIDVSHIKGVTIFPDSEGVAISCTSIAHFLAVYLTARKSGNEVFLM